MAHKKLIFQGITPHTHLAAVRELFDIDQVEAVLLSVAFVSESGVRKIEDCLETEAKRVVVFAGVRNEITSYQGLARVHQLGCSLYTVDTGSRSLLFHPKIYFVKSKAVARAIIGSANLTLGGLNNNIEAGLALEFDLSDPDDRKISEEIEAEFAKLPASYPKNIEKVTSISSLNSMLAEGRLVDEVAVPPPRPSTSAAGGKGDSVPRIKLKVSPIRPLLKKAKAPTAKPKSAKAPASGGAGSTSVTPAGGVEYELVWESKALERRDLTIPTAAGTHRTGSMSLDKGLLPEEVDHRHYFREDVFPSLSWSPATATTEKAFAKFHVVVKGISHGEFDLRIGHTIGTTSPAYMQNNAMTRLSWGAVRDFIAKPELIGSTLLLYRDKTDPKKFLLEID